MFIYKKNKNKTNFYSFLILFFFNEARLSTDLTTNKSDALMLVHRTTTQVFQLKRN